MSSQDGLDECPVLHELLERTAARLPKHPALEFNGAVLTYAELDAIAEAFADSLSHYGVGRGLIVGLVFNKSLEMVVAVVGVLKAGAAYLPLLPVSQVEAKLETLQEAGSQHVALQSEHLQSLEAFAGAKVVLDDCRKLLGNCNSVKKAKVRPDDPAYVIFTSGSTGRPKGVIMHHGGTAMNIQLNARLTCQEGERCCFSNKYTFDVHVADIFKPLSVGGVVVVTNNIYGIPPVDVLSTLPSKLAVAKVPTRLKVIGLTGEGVNEAALRPVPKATRVVNIFGATEFFDATAKVIDWSTFPENLQCVGRPLGSYVKLWIVDVDTMEPVAADCPGELVVGGRQVARGGYINRPEVTASKFVQAPWAAGEQVYRTGDLACCTKDGEFHHLGRAVHRVEVRGKRVDLSEVEVSLASVDGIMNAVVIWKEDELTGKLVAFVSPGSAKPLADEAAAAMPSERVPDIIIGVDEWPHTNNGKIDRSVLAQVTPDGVLPSVGSDSAPIKRQRSRWIFQDPPPLPQPSSSTSRYGKSKAPNASIFDPLDAAELNACADFANSACAGQLEALATTLRLEAYRLGVVFFNKPLPACADVAPMSALPSPVPEVWVDKLKQLAPIFNRLIDRVSCDVNWLVQKLEPAAAVDQWIARLLQMARDIYGKDGVKNLQNTIRLLLTRQDYLPHLDRGYQQVEINTIAVAFAGMTEQLAKVHATALRNHCPELTTRFGQQLQDNRAGTEYARALAAAHEAYLKGARSEATAVTEASSSWRPRVCFFCFAADHLEMDQRHIEAALWELGVPSFRALLGAEVEVRGGDAARFGADGALIIDGVETSVVYFHCTYQPEHFATEKDWEIRRLMELSKAVKVPSLPAHLAGCKKIQEVLSDPRELRRFLCDDEAAQCESVFAQQVDPAHSSSSSVVEEALEHPERWLLKPQREGGGNNLYGDQLEATLHGKEGLEQFVLMSKIISEPVTSMLLRGAEDPKVETTISELGIFASHLVNGQEEVLSTAGGAMLRTKMATSQEGGVCCGAGVIDTPFLVRPGARAAAGVARTQPADACVVLVCGPPGNRRRAFCGELLARGRADPLLLGGTSAVEWHRVCHDEAEAESSAPSAAGAAAAASQVWCHAREKVKQLMTDRINGRTMPGIVLLLESSMYRQGTRRQWARFAQDHSCAFFEVLLKASSWTWLEPEQPPEATVPEHLERPASATEHLEHLEPPEATVPEFVVEHMAEHLERPASEDAATVSLSTGTILDLDGIAACDQVDVFLTRFAGARPSTGIASPFCATGCATPSSTRTPTPSAARGSATHSLDLALRKIVSRALQKVPKELLSEKPGLAARWNTLKRTLVASLSTASGELGEVVDEIEEYFLRSCAADVRGALSRKTRAARA